MSAKRTSVRSAFIVENAPSLALLEVPFMILQQECGCPLVPLFLWRDVILKATHFEFDKPEAARNKTAVSIIVLKFIPQGDGAILLDVTRIGSIRDRDEALTGSLTRKPLR
ncbi:MAG: hypothetical protein VXX31_13070 [Planctomycetota bacterium]|nr:hypothetical protein [Planctomycetota bacterium]